MHSGLDKIMVTAGEADMSRAALELVKRDGE